jgi:hypothetical protein
LLKENDPLMLKIIIAFDNQDEDLGDYFTACKVDIVDFLEEQQINGFPLEIVEIMDSRLCNPVYIEIKLEEYQNQPLLFIAYSHGLPHALSCKGSYIDSSNVHLLFNACLHTNACSSAKVLGRYFIEKEGIFLGFDEPVDALIDDTNGAKQISINCDNYGIKYSIIMRDKTIVETYHAMINYYEENIRKLDYFNASLLTETKKALKIYGNKEITMNQFINQR